MNSSNPSNLRSAPPTSNDAKPLASISLDLDNQWSYMKTHGDPGWESFPSYLDIFIPHVLDILDHLNLKITFFIVGQDASLEKNREVLSLLTKEGHEIGNHSFHHEPWLHSYSKEQIKREVLGAEEHIFRVTGQKPIGFRGPGFSWNSDLLEILGENNYVYDASTFPTSIGPLARAYYFWRSNFTKEEKDKRKKLFGGLKEGLRPLKPYYWHLASGRTLLEIPITTMPIIRTPFHLSYLIYLSRFSKRLMFFYLDASLEICRITGVEPSFLLHPLDLIGSDQAPELFFFPGMDLNVDDKTGLFLKVLKMISRRFHLVNLSSYAHFALTRDNIRCQRPS